MPGNVELLQWLFASSALLAAIFAAVRRYWTRDYGRWARSSVPHPEPAAPFGNLGDVLKGGKSINTLLHELYRRYDGQRYFGLYEARSPALVVRDPELARAVIVGDFAHFHDRIRNNVSFRHDGLFEHLVNLRGDRWKAVRTKLSPTFSAAKLKSMTEDMRQCCARLIRQLNDRITDKHGVVDVSEVSAQLTTDTIGRCAFGLEFNTLSDPKSEFRRTGRDVFVPTRRSQILNFIRLIGFGKILDVFRIRGLPDRVYDFFDSILEIAMKQHETGENSRNDFISLLVKLKTEEKLSKHEEKVFTDEILTANAFVFFIAGFETTATTISYCLYELAMNIDIQVKVRESIKKTLDENEGHLTYESLKDLKYLDMVINETFRLHPPVPILQRVCTSKYTLPNSNVTLNLGDKVFIPVYSLHHDAAYYPNPDVFDPERFTEENKASRPPGTFYPFGDGPRICIGMRFALMEVKLGLSEILTNFEVRPCEATKTPIEFMTSTILLTPKDPIKLNFKKIQ